MSIAASLYQKTLTKLALIGVAGRAQAGATRLMLQDIPVEVLDAVLEAYEAHRGNPEDHTRLLEVLAHDPREDIRRRVGRLAQRQQGSRGGPTYGSGRGEKGLS